MEERRPCLHSLKDKVVLKQSLIFHIFTEAFTEAMVDTTKGVNGERARNQDGTPSISTCQDYFINLINQDVGRPRKSWEGTKQFSLETGRRSRP